jgi:hypothetical protein
MVVALLPLAAHAAENARIEVHGFAPVVCHADFVSVPLVTPGKIRLGLIREFCNAGAGYQVVVEYRPTAHPGALLIDGRCVALDGSGRAVIQSSRGPAERTSFLAYLPGRDRLATLNVSIHAAAL